MTIDERTEAYQATQAFLIQHKLVTAEGLQVGDPVEVTKLGTQVVSLLLGVHTPSMSDVWDILNYTEGSDEQKQGIAELYPDEQVLDYDN